MNRNVLSWLTSQAPQAAHALILTHNISFVFVQSVLLPRLRATGDPRVTIFADAGCAAGSWRRERALISGLGAWYRVVPVDLGPYRRFHPKVLLLTNPTRAALAIGSGNLTHGGMGANREAWAFGASDDDGAPRVAALRDYLGRLVDGLPLGVPLRDVVDAIFDPSQAWAEGLPEPGGLASAPARASILEQLAEAAGSVTGATVLSPYFDDRGEALAAIADRFQAPVTALLQPGHVGLCAAAAASLPEGVSLKTAQVASDRPGFIHAKVLALHREADVLVAVGSANCSRAALLAGAQTGNAELMAWSIEPADRVDALLGQLQVDDQPPPLPAEPLSVDWDDETPPVFRILAARQEADQIEVAFTPNPGIVSLAVVGAGEWPTEALDLIAGLAKTTAPVRLRTISLRAELADGGVLESPESWVDDEISLGAPATLRRVLKRIEDVETGSDPARAYESLLAVFHDYLRDPEAARRRLHRTAPQTLDAPYDPASVFDDDFGLTGLPTLGRDAGAGGKPPSALAIIERLFGIGREITAPPPPDPPERDGDDLSDIQDDDLLNSEAVGARQQPKDSAAVARAVGRMEAALTHPAFSLGRSPALLSHDVALAAILLVMGVSTRGSNGLAVDRFRETTRRLWSHLFFGQGDQPGAIQARMAREPDPEAFLGAFATPRLAAALSVWCATEWSATDDQAAWFRLSATDLQSRWPRLFAGADPQAVLVGLGDLGASLLPANDQAASVAAWRQIVRAGRALELLRAGFETAGMIALRAAPRAAWLEPTDLVWAVGAFGFPVDRARHDPSAKIAIRPAGGQDAKKVLGDFVVSVRTAVANRLLDLPIAALPEIDRVISALERGA